MELEPKEKAKQLVSDFTKLNRGNQTFNVKYNNGIRGALLCVNEMEKVNMKTNADECVRFIKYWREVKKELQTL